MPISDRTRVLLQCPLQRRQGNINRLIVLSQSIGRRSPLMSKIAKGARRVKSTTLSGLNHSGSTTTTSQTRSRIRHDSNIALAQRATYLKSEYSIVCTRGQY